MKYQIRIIAVVVGLVSSVLAFGTQSSLQNTTSSGSEILSLEVVTQKLLELNTLARGKKGPALVEVQDQAKQRRDLMLSLIDKDPGKILKVALSSSLRDSVDYGARNYIEERVKNFEGKFEEVASMSFSGPLKNEYLLETDSGEQFIIHFTEPLEVTPKTGDRVKFTSALLISDDHGKSHLIPFKETPDAPLIHLTKVSSAIPFNSTGVRSTGNFAVLGVVLNFQDQAGSQPWTTASVLSMLQGIQSFYSDNSFQQAKLSVSVAGWYTLPIASTCDLGTIANSAIAALTSSGFNIASYNRLVFMFPPVKSCAWAGMSYVGELSPGFSESFINGYNLVQIAGHELGHTFGLNHSHSNTCTGGPIGGTCTSTEYGDVADIMGNTSAADFNAFQKENLGWLNAPSMGTITTVQSSGQYSIEPAETISTNPKALKIEASSPSASTHNYYYVEYRQLLGQDLTAPGIYGNGLSWNTANGNLTKGVLLHLATPGSNNSSQLLNLTPSDTSFHYAALVGSTLFTDPNAPQGGVKISLVSATSTGATVSVNFGTVTPTCVRANPSLSFTPNTAQWVTPGNAATYLVSLKNNDSSACGNSTFNLLSYYPNGSGVSGSLSSTSVNLAPGASGIVNWTVGSAVSTATGVYSITVYAANGAAPSYSFSSSTTLGVQAPAFAPISVNGGAGSVTDSTGVTWVADYGFSGGNTYTSPDPQLATLAPEYKSERFGNFSYLFSVPNGSYHVTLKFAEIYWKAANLRLFNVTLNGAAVIQNLDIYSKVGYGVPYDQTFPVTVTNGQINVVFSTIKDNAKISAIQISQ